MHADKMQESKWNSFLFKSWQEESQILCFPLFSDKQENTASTSLMVRDIMIIKQYVLIIEIDMFSWTTLAGFISDTCLFLSCSAMCLQTQLLFPEESSLFIWRFQKKSQMSKGFLLLLPLLFLLLCLVLKFSQLLSINTSSPCFRKSPLSGSLLMPALSEFSFQSKAMSNVKHLRFLTCHLSEFRVPVYSASLLWRQS